MNTREDKYAESTIVDNDTATVNAANEPVSGSILSGLWRRFKSAINPTGKFTNVTNLISQAGQKIQEEYNKVGERIATKINAPINWAVEKVADSVITKAKTCMEGADLSLVADAVGKVVENVANGVSKEVDTAATQVAAQATASIEQISSQVRKSVDSIGDKVGDNVNKMSSKFSSSFTQTLKDFTKTGTSFLDNLIPNLEKSIIAFIMIPFTFCFKLLNGLRDFFGLSPIDNSLDDIQSNSSIELPQRKVESEFILSVSSSSPSVDLSWKEKNKSESTVSGLHTAMFPGLSSIPLPSAQFTEKDMEEKYGSSCGLQ